jgi:hypothetical protein
MHEIVTQNGLKVNIANYIRFQNQIYAITQIYREIGDELYIAQIECEHCSNALNDEQYNIPAFVFNGTPAQGLAQLLSGTPLSVGVVEPTGNFNIQYTDGELTLRAALMNFISDVGGEIEYSGVSVNIRNHRGSITPVELMNGQHATNLAKTELRGKATAYEIPLFRLGSLKLGDEVHIKYTPLDIDVNTRIIGLEYNPFYEIGTVRIEVGAYIPEQLSASNSQLQKIKQEFKVADGELLSKIWNEDGGLSEIHQTLTQISLTVTSNKTTADGQYSELASSIIQTASSITATVTQNKQTADGLYTTLSSQITQTATSILSTVSADYATKAERANGDASTLNSANSAISQKATEILSTVSTTYATQTGLAAANAAITAGDSATLTAASSAIS